MGVGGLKCTPEELWVKHFFSDLFKKKILSKSGLHFRANCCMAELQAMKQSFQRCAQLAGQDYFSWTFKPSNSKFQKKISFFYFEDHFGMKKVLLAYVFLIFFQNPCEISFKMVLLTLYLSFHLKSGKKFFRCRFYLIFFVF